MKTSICALAVLIGGTHSAFAEAPRITFDGLDTAAALNKNLDALNDVKSSTDAPRFSEIWSGVTPGGYTILLGVNDADIEFLAASTRGHFGPNDRADIVSMERFFGLEGIERSVGSCGDAAGSPAIECTAIFYACPEAPPLCHVTMFSFGSEEAGRVRLSWEAEPVDLTVSR